MGYFAKGYGNLYVFKKDIDNAIELIGQMMSYDCVDILYESNRYVINVEYDRKFHFDDFGKFLDRLAPYVDEGEICFFGEDDRTWKYKISDGDWKKYSGISVYQDDVFYVVIQKEKWSIFLSKEDAEIEKERLEKENISSKIIQSNIQF